MTDERIKEEAIELAEAFTDWMGASWPMCGGINATVKLADMASKRFKVAERLAKIEVLESVLDLVNCGRTESILQDVEEMLSELKEAILSSPVKEGKTDAEKLDIAVKALEKISGRGMTGGGIAKRALKEIQHEQKI